MNMMNRRGFLGGLIGLVIVPFLPKVPWNHKNYLGPLTSEQFLTRCWNDFARGSGRAHQPTNLYASPGLYNDFKKNLQTLTRFDPHETPSRSTSLMFKSGRIESDISNNFEWDVYVMNESRGQRYTLPSWQRKERG